MLNRRGSVATCLSSRSVRGFRKSPTGGLGKVLGVPLRPLSPASRGKADIPAGPVRARSGSVCGQFARGCGRGPLIFRAGGARRKISEFGSPPARAPLPLSRKNRALPHAGRSGKRCARAEYRLGRLLRETERAKGARGQLQGRDVSGGRFIRRGLCVIWSIPV